MLSFGFHPIPSPEKVYHFTGLISGVPLLTRHWTGATLPNGLRPQIYAPTQLIKVGRRTKSFLMLRSSLVLVFYFAEVRKPKKHRVAAH